MLESPSQPSIKAGTMSRVIRSLRTAGVSADLRYACRTLANARSFTVAAVATLAIGIGVTTAIYSVVDGILFKPLPYSHPDQVVALFQNDRKKGTSRDDVAPANFTDWRARTTSFSAMASAEPFGLVYQTADGVEQVYTWNVSQDFFRVLDARPALGRLFAESDYAPGPPRTLVLTYRSWQTRFGGDPRIIGRGVPLNTGVATIVGVLPANFDYLADSKMELFAPKVLSAGEQQIRNNAWYKIVGRLRSGVSLAQARRDLDNVAAELRTEYPTTNATVGATVVPLGEAIYGGTRRALALLFGAVVVVLLIACANVANLALARGARRKRELAVRGALGASRARLARQLLLEYLVVATAGGVVGAIAASGIVRAIRVSSQRSVPRLADVHLDARSLLFMLAVVVLITVTFGLIPAMRSASVDAHSVLRAGTRAAGDVGRGHLRTALVVVEVALAFTLLVGSGLLTRSFVAVVGSDRGYRTDHVLAAPVFVYRWNRTAGERIRFIDALVRRGASVPGVIAAGATSSLPLDIAIGEDRGTFTIEGRSFAVGQEPSVHMTAMTPTAFGALRIPLRRGRLFEQSDDSASAPVVVINEAMERRYWPGRDPIGQRLRFAFNGDTALRTVVGIAADTRQRALDAPPEPIIYVPHAQAPSGAMVILLRTSNEPRTVLGDFQRAVRELNPALPLAGVETLDELASASLKPREFVLTQFSAFTLCAFVLGMIGVYAVVNQRALARRSEIGVRIALGAPPGTVGVMIAREALVVASAGIALGGVGVVVLAAMLRNMLIATTPFDLPTLAIVVVVTLAAAGIAAWIPAFRASRVDPVEALRAS